LKNKTVEDSEKDDFSLEGTAQDITSRNDKYQKELLRFPNR
jgi:hypothetical protein